MVRADDEVACAFANETFDASSILHNHCDPSRGPGGGLDPRDFGISVILWYWLFAAAACILAIVGVFRVVGGLHAPLWIGVALALPGFVWAANRLYELTSSVPHLGIFFLFYWAAFLALVAAAIGALRLIETISTPHAAFRVGYGVLAASALLVGVGWVAYATGWAFTHNALYQTPTRALEIAAKLIAYGAFIAVAAVITMRRGIERWTGVAISLIGAYLLYKAVSQTFLLHVPGRGDGAAAIWRMGTVLRAQTLLERST